MSSTPPAPASGLRLPAALRPLLRSLGLRARAAAAERLQTLRFLGEVLQAMTESRATRGRTRVLLAEFLTQFDQAGPRSAPIVLLVSALVGLILAYMGGEQLRLFGAQSFVAPLVAVGEVREIGALMVGIVLAGRVGSAYAAQLATMQGSDEIDALRVMGVNPVRLLVLPRLAALALAAPLLTAMGSAAGIAAGCAVAVWVHGVPAQDYLTRSIEALSLSHLLVGWVKGFLYGLLVGLAGCRQGLAAERSATGVGRATTDAVVQAIVWVTVAASLTTVLFQRLGW